MTCLLSFFLNGVTLLSCNGVDLREGEGRKERERSWVGEKERGAER